MRNTFIRKSVLFQYLVHYLSSLRDWCPREFSKYDIPAFSFTLLRDAHVCPSMVLSHSPQTVAIVCLSIALRTFRVGTLTFAVLFNSSPLRCDAQRFSFKEITNQHDIRLVHSELKFYVAFTWWYKRDLLNVPTLSTPVQFS